MAATYDLDAYDEVLDDPKCAVCGDVAMKRCSRCHLEWYCSRPCQVKAWNQHKSICEVICKKQKQKSTSAATVNPTLITSVSSTPSTSTTPSASQLASMDASTLIRQLHINEDKENTQKSSNATNTTSTPATTTKRPMIEVLDD